MLAQQAGTVLIGISVWLITAPPACLDALSGGHSTAEEHAAGTSTCKQQHALDQLHLSSF